MKKINPIKPLFLYGLLGLCSTACNSDDGHIPMPKPEAACRLTFINLPDEIPEGTHAYYTGVEYNDRGYVSRIFTTSSSIEGGTMFTYNASNQLVKEERYMARTVISYYTYEYTNGLPTTTTIYSGGEEGGNGVDFEMVGFIFNTYNNKKQLIESKSDDGTFITTYTYDNRGNLTKWEEFINGKFYYRTTYENYDNHPTPYSGVKGLPVTYSDLPGLYSNYSKNNFGKATRFKDTNNDGIIQPDEELEASTYTYTYNSNGYPSEITEKRPHFTITNKFAYQCD